MHITRVQIEEGFLDGVDVTLTDGLNALIGARGTGKTSFIELVRFCLDVSSHLSETSRKSRDHALSVLDGGQITVTMRDGDQEILVSRSAADKIPQVSGPYAKPMIFSQTEIESIGLEPKGRLRLIDGFIEGRFRDALTEDEAVAKASSLSAQVRNLVSEIEELQQQVAQASEIDNELAHIATQESHIANASIDLHKKTKNLQDISDKSAAASVAHAGIQRAQDSIYSWYAAAKETLDNAPERNEPTSIFNEYSQDFSQIQSSLNDAVNGISRIWHELEARKKNVEKEKLDMDASARVARQEIEVLQAGAGQIMRRAQIIKEQKARIVAVTNLCRVKRDSLGMALRARNLELDRIEDARENRFKARSAMCENFNSLLLPNIKLTITRNGQTGAFSAVLSELLRGSGIKYSEISPVLARSLSPRALIEAVDNFDFELLAHSAGISVERASKVLNHLRNIDLSSLVSVDVEDEVSMYLLDGRDYKHITELSTGQRCTVILPIVLAHADRVVIVDQPEDHIDNAFIASTLIKAILSRKTSGQIVFSTHNPNIPVLGDAENVIQLSSDGRRGYVSASGQLSKSDVVEAISTVMEGGEAAFSRRARFYDENLL